MIDAPAMYRARTDAQPLESAFFKLPDTLLLVFDAHWQLLQVSEAWAAALGYPLDDLFAIDFISLLHEQDRPANVARLQGLDANNPTLRFLSRCRCADGDYLGVAWNVTYDAEAGCYFASAHETAMSLGGSEGHLPEVFIDGLTGLPNRSLFLDRLEHTLRRSERRSDLQFAVLYCGIDRFKVINHSLGHRLGDLLLVCVANLLRNTIRPTDMVARLAGDEFAMLLEDIRDVSATLHVVNRIQQKLVLPFTLNEHEVFSTVSFGIVASGPEYTQPDAMIRDANMAMTQAKAHGGGGYVVFNRDMHERAVRRMELEMDLRHAIERQQLQAYYQPIVNLANGKLSGFEALARWNHPLRGLVSPVEFIPVAEETGLIVAVGRWMLGEACRQIKDWQQRLPEAGALTVSVNLSSKQLQHPDLLADIDASLAEHQIDPRHLKLEITESVMMQNAEQAILLLEQIRARGIRLMLDDFGTGYSSLAHLHRLPIDTLKIDRSFISKLHENPTDRHFVETIVHLARMLRQEVVCEGVERLEQAQILRELQVQYSQGFLYSRPVAANEAEMQIVSGLSPPEA